MNTKLQSIKKYIENNTEETIKLINSVINSDIESLNEIKEIANNKFFAGLNLSTNEKPIILTFCNKNSANDLVYKFWAYYCKSNLNKNISLLDAIDMKAYSKEQHHDIMEIKNEEKKIKIKIHYIFNDELVKKELINEDELLVLIENF